MKPRTIIFWICVLVIADQAIKIIIDTFYFEGHFEIIPSMLEFKPIFNDKHSYFNVLLNNKFNINVGLIAHLLLFLVLEIVVISLYFLFRKHINKSRKLLDIAFVFQISGLICALSGNLIWENGVLDYLYLKPLFIFDLKDLYNNVFAILFLVYIIINASEVKALEEKDIISHIRVLLKRDNKQ